MTRPTDEELDEMARELCHTGELSMLYRCEISDAITALRAQLAEAKAGKEKLGRELNLARYGQPDFSWQIHKEALAAANARADRAEAALAAQIEYGPVRTGLVDKDGREICVGDRLRHLNSSQSTKKEYWFPEYEVIWEAPSFRLKPTGGGKPSYTGFYFKYYSREFETILAQPHSRAASQPDPVTNAGCRQPVKVKPLVWERYWPGCFSVKSLKTADNECEVIYYAEMARESRHMVNTVTKPGYFRCWIDWGEEYETLEAAKAAAQADYEDRILAALEPAPRVNETPKSEHDSADVLAAMPAPVAPSLRITGPNSDGEYWLHIKAGGWSGGVNLGGEHGPICKRLLDAASETGAKE